MARPKPRLPDGRLLDPQTDLYRFVTPTPAKIGDWAEIEIGDYAVTVAGRSKHLRFISPRRVRVIWLEATDGTRWLVERK